MTFLLIGTSSLIRYNRTNTYTNCLKKHYHLDLVRLIYLVQISIVTISVFFLFQYFVYFRILSISVYCPFQYIVHFCILSISIFCLFLYFVNFRVLSILVFCAFQYYVHFSFFLFGILSI